jgi:hypothetical protein
MAITATRVGAPWIVGQGDGGGRDRQIPRAALNRDRGAVGVGPVVGRAGRANEAVGQVVGGGRGVLTFSSLDAGCRSRTSSRIILWCEAAEVVVVC